MFLINLIYMDTYTYKHIYKYYLLDFHSFLVSASHYFFFKSLLRSCSVPADSEQCWRTRDVCDITLSPRSSQPQKSGIGQLWKPSITTNNKKFSDTAKALIWTTVWGRGKELGWTALRKRLREEKYLN